MIGTQSNSFVKPLSTGPPKPKDLEQSKHLEQVCILSPMFEHQRLHGIERNGHVHIARYRQCRANAELEPVYHNQQFLSKACDAWWLAAWSELDGEKRL